VDDVLGPPLADRCRQGIHHPFGAQRVIIDPAAVNLDQAA
jgi:hypothetical protein